MQAKQKLKSQSEKLSSEIKSATKSGQIKPAKKKALKNKLKELAAQTAATVAQSEGENSKITLLTNEAIKNDGNKTASASIADRIKVLNNAQHKEN